MYNPIAIITKSHIAASIKPIIPPVTPAATPAATPACTASFPSSLPKAINSCKKIIFLFSTPFQVLISIILTNNYSLNMYPMLLSLIQRHKKFDRFFIL